MNTPVPPVTTKVEQPPVHVQQQQDAPIESPKPNVGAEIPATGQLENVVRNGSSGEMVIPGNTLKPLDKEVESYGEEATEPSEANE